MSISWRAAFLFAALMALTACWPAVTVDTNNQGQDQPAATDDPLPSCYPGAQIDRIAPEPRRAVFVLVDQTTGLDSHLRDTIRTNVRHLLTPGSSFSISIFSAYTPNYYATVLKSGALEATVPDQERPSLSVPGLRRLDDCLRGQKETGLRLVQEALDQATSVPSSNFNRSEIMASLSQLSGAVRASRAPDKIVIVVSDLLEHSTVSSFYSARNLRMIDPDAEMQRAVASRLVGDFADARLVVIGAGLLPPDSAPDAGRDAQKLDALRRFWETWFRQSRANLIAWGQPDLVAPVE